MGLIRLVLALSVVVWHMPGATWKLLNAAVAVLCFFIISGFYMALVLNTKYDNAKDFYVARVVRLYPAYIAMCAIMVGWFWWTTSPNVFTSPVPVSVTERLILIASNILLIGQDIFE